MGSIARIMVLDDDDDVSVIVVVLVLSQVLDVVVVGGGKTNIVLTFKTSLSFSGPLGVHWICLCPVAKVFYVISS